MINKSVKNSEKELNLCRDEQTTEVLCQFLLDDAEYWVVQYETDTASLPDQAFSELMRFHVKDCCCAILQKHHDQEHHDSIALSTLLSPRELQIATLVALGCPNKQIADKLHISEWTVGTHLRRIFAKLKVDTRAAMTYRCAALIYKTKGSPT
jgi:DNA-binding CsgD family transcriptional regulator